MNSLIADDLTRENLASETAKCLGDILSNNNKLTSLHNELLEVNLTLKAYIEESKDRLRSFRLALANKAATTSTQQVVEILSAICKFTLTSKMSASPTLAYNRFSRTNKPEGNNNNKSFELQQARTFIRWFKHMIDDERSSLSLYFSDDAILEWFGRTIKTRKKVSSFLKYDMQCSRHDFTTVENIEKIQLRSDKLQRKDDSILDSPLQSPEIIKKSNKRKLFGNVKSPEWAEGCRPLDEGPECPEKICKRENENTHPEIHFNGRKRLFCDDETFCQGDGVCQPKRKCVDTTVTPPNKEVGQGDCLPSTSGTESNKSHDTLNAQLPKLAVECNGYIEFARTRNSHSIESMKWERKCKVQISYSKDPLNVGEYIIWMIRYMDETKCRRNLLAAFEEASLEQTSII